MSLAELTEASRRAEQRAHRIQVVQTCAVLALCGGLAVGASLVDDRQPVIRVALVVDASPTNDPETRCSDLSAMLAPYHGRSWDGHELQVELWSSGAIDSGREPLPLAVLTRPAAPSGIEALRGDDRLAVFEADLQTACKAVVTTMVSPLFRAGMAAANDLANPTDASLACSEEHVTCHFLMRSDFIEEEDAVLVAAREGDASQTRDARLPVLGLDRVFLCGFSQRTTTRVYPPAGDIQATWWPEIPEAAVAVSSFANACS